MTDKLACMAGDRLGNSSRNSVPPLAASNNPIRAVVGVSEVPRSCPNSSDSASVSGIAEQLTSTSGWRPRGPR